MNAQKRKARKKTGEKGKTVKRYYRYEENHRVVKGVKQKRCYRCRRWKPESMYYRRCRSKDGLYVWCKECANKATNHCRRQRKLAQRK